MVAVWANKSQSRFMRFPMQVARLPVIRGLNCRAHRRGGGPYADIALVTARQPAMYSAGSVCKPRPLPSTFTPRRRPNPRWAAPAMAAAYVVWWRRALWVWCSRAAAKGLATSCVGMWKIAATVVAPSTRQAMYWRRFCRAGPVVWRQPWRRCCDFGPGAGSPLVLAVIAASRPRPPF